jgi:dipeptidyl aminopeptidase/acylaminoacyl peptidase
MKRSIRPPLDFFRLRRQLSVLLTLAMALSTVALAQQKRSLTAGDFDSWRSIQGQTISRDGKFIAYAAVAQDGDGEVIARNLATGKEWRAPRGAQPTFTPAPPGGEGPPPVFGARVSFTADSRFLVFQILPTKAETDKAKKEKKKPEDMPKSALGIMDLSTGEVARVERVKNFQVPEEGAGFIAYLLEAKKEERRPEGGAPAAGATPAAAPAAAVDKKKKEYGSELVLRNLNDRTERSFADVLEYSLSKDAKHLLYAVSSKKEESNGIYAATTASADAAAPLLSGKGKYAKLTWDDKQTQAAFISDRDDASAAQPKFKLYHWQRSTPAAAEIVSPASANFRQGWVVSDKANLSFSLDGATLFLGVVPAPEPEKEDDGPADEKVIADLWHYKDDYIQPMQKVRAEQEKNRSYRAVYHLKEKKFVQLADDTMRELSPANDGRWALGQDDREYRILVGYSDDANSSDVYLVNTIDGSRKLLFKKQRGGTSWSPNGKYALFYDGKNWNTVSIPDGKVINLTANLGVNFYNEEHDSPSTPGSYGSAGWTSDDKYVLIYDKYDIWQIAPDGSGAKNLTDGVGRREKTQFRYVRLDPQERGIDAAKPMLLRAENDWTLDSGFYRDKVNGGMPEKLLMAAKAFNNPAKAKDADVYLLSASTFSEYPDLLVSNANFNDLKKVSDLGKQKEPFIWGTSELVRFKNSDGVPLSGMLVKPENFDPNKKYPLMVYIYERLSDGLHRFVNPAPGQNVNPTYYASNGYLVLMPDIVYTIGHPGQSAIKCVLPAIQAVVDKGYVNENAIGIQGHSWGGYQIAYMITQTTRFKAAAAGAPVANMTSAYSGIRWGTGLPRQFQYEHTQSRIGANLWEAPMLYLENSPVFRADRVQTPLLMLHNDNDDAVPWYQGIEYFLALRRLGKEVYMFNYNGEPHGLRRRQNLKDYAMRLQQFFDYELKGAAKPAWMEKGIPYLEREKEKEKYRPAAAATAAGDVKAKAQN